MPDPASREKNAAKPIVGIAPSFAGLRPHRPGDKSTPID
jgi:hypothetical protein